MTITEAREENLRLLRERYPKGNVQFLDMDYPSPVSGAPFDVVHCYGLLYHLNEPEQALEFLSKSTTKYLFLETCVSFGDGDDLNPVVENRRALSQAVSGAGCRPTRPWVFKRLSALFEKVYVPTTQPNHEEFPTDWNAPERHPAGLSRAVFIASREPLENDLLSQELTDKQLRSE